MVGSAMVTFDLGLRAAITSMVGAQAVKAGIGREIRGLSALAATPAALAVGAALAFTLAFAFAFATHLVDTTLIGHRERTGEQGR